jgi:RNA polymerase sigma factor (sigma-70 family)
MSSGASVTTWIGLLEMGQLDAAQRLWERYFQRLVNYSRGRLGGVNTRVEDEEDIAISAFSSFCEAVATKRIPQLNGREDLWRVLVMIAAGKAVDLRRRQTALKRAQPNPVQPGSNRELDMVALEDIVGAEPDPAFAAQVAEEFQALLAMLNDETLKEVALLKLEGQTNEEIAERLKCSPRTVTRQVAEIRKKWESRIDFGDGPGLPNEGGSALE